MVCAVCIVLIDFKYHMLQIKKSSFYNDYSQGTCGVVDKAGARTRKGDFAIKVVSFVKAGENTGYFCNIRREMDGIERYAYTSLPVVINNTSCDCFTILGYATSSVAPSGLCTSSLNNSTIPLGAGEWHVPLMKRSYQNLFPFSGIKGQPHSLS